MQGSQLMITTVGYIVFIAVIGYFLIIRPGKKRKEAKAVIETQLEIGSKVVTIGGFVGEVTKVEEDSVIIKSGKSELEIKKGAIQNIVEQEVA